MDENFIEDNLGDESFLACAARLAETIETQEDYSQIMSFIAVRCAEVGLLDAAIQLAENVSDPYIRDLALSGVSAECVEFGEKDYADELLGMIEDPSIQSVAMEKVAVKYAETGAFDEALEIAEQIEDNGQTFSRIALIYSDSGLSSQAIDVARSIVDEALRAATLIELASRDFHSNHAREAAEQLLIEARESAEKVEFPQERINALLDVASLYKEIGDEEQALEILSFADRLSDRLEDQPYTGLTVTFARDEARARIAARFAEIGRFDEVDKVMGKIDDPFQFASAAAGVAVEYKKAGQSEQALNLLTEAFELAKEEVYGERTLIERDKLLAALAAAYAETGHLEEALKAVKMISLPDVQFEAWKDMAKACARAGNHNGIFQVADLIENPYARVFYYLEASETEAGLEQAELADRLLSQALIDTETIELPFEKALALMEVAFRFAQREEQSAKASEILFQSLNAAAEIESSYQLASVLVRLDDRYRKAGFEPGDREESALQKIAP